MSKRMGRPTESPKNKLLQVRLDSETMQKLDTCAKYENTTRSEIVRKGINEVFDDIKK